MKAIHLTAVGEGVSLEELDLLSAELARMFGTSCHVLTATFPAGYALHPDRRQYHSTAILSRMAPVAESNGVRLLGVTGHDLFVPVLTFVFGEAQLNGPAALVSAHRLREEYYGLPADARKFQDRLLKEAVHELGHTFGLRHCSDWRCVMASTHAVERLDVKEAGFCTGCRRSAGL